VDNSVFGARPHENASQINGTQSQMACSVERAPFFGAIQPTLQRRQGIATGISSSTTAALVLYPGEINDSQLESWPRLIDAFDWRQPSAPPAALFPADLLPSRHAARQAQAAGLTPRAVLDKLAAIQMLDVHFATTDGRTLILSRCTELNADQKLLVKHLIPASTAHHRQRRSGAPRCGPVDVVETFAGGRWFY
jgi:hypothetical protein